MHFIKTSGLAALALLATIPAHAADKDVLTQFGILGHLAVDCAAPASGTNPKLIYAVAEDGQASRTLQMGQAGGDTLNPMKHARLIRGDLLQYEERGLNDTTITITMVKTGGKFRSWNSYRSDATLLISDGKFTGPAGGDTPTFTRCGE